jgi:hypothetical protein
MGLADDSGLRPHITTFAAERGTAVSRDEIESAVAEAVSANLGVTLKVGALSAAEETRGSELRAGFSIQTVGGLHP